MYKVSTLLAVTLPSLVSAIPLTQRSTSSLTHDASVVSNQTFDYIIAGGGVTGLTVASKLSEDPSIRVLVVEGGSNDWDDAMVHDIRTYGQAFGTYLDYNLTSTPISWRNGETLPMIAGHTLGGSGSINGASWTKAPKSQYDLLPLVTGDESWAFDSFNEIMLSAEKFTPPTQALTSKGANYVPAYHGTNGNVSVSFAQGIFSSIQLPAINASQMVWEGLEVAVDAASGEVNGVTTIPNMVQPDESETRASPYASWIKGTADTRPNLVILLGHRVVKLDWSSTEEGADLVASGIQFQQSRSSPILTAHASRDVILAAGSMQSPQLLELSGVGDATVLANAGIPLVKSVPGVGKNLQEQTKSSLYYTPISTAWNGTGPSTAIAFPNAWQLLRSNASAVYNATIASLPAYAAQLAASGSVVNATATAQIMRLQIESLFANNEPAAEVFWTIDTAGQTVGADIWNLIPLARGTVHVQSDNSWDQPAIDAAYFGHELDTTLQVLATRQARDVYAAEPLASMVSGEITPGLERVALEADDAAWTEWVKSEFTSVWHPVATLSRMAEQDGGVVDESFRVYGVQNVRVVDASVLPVQLSAHLSSSLYGIALKAAGIIREDQ
ncbi:uncharacterized protein BCR38DRAFT_347929 [Pseudomassariella vexata]|uniref:Glucose-methanol-choline oxidoreductase N-terminal domain-containing protein n=1 Tax=Pseudomassariella vexata TaxID=1141098 RepID=A0A1Y2DT19_9PEZI|nr:uncharacterized protein BCR38DRAFT_347929 [Pseudomassariella vexata]ORY61805.1 hypothetical protein BCR38DRAFT_347929 [Pseudomassariella vexata]